MIDLVVGILRTLFQAVVEIAKNLAVNLGVETIPNGIRIGTFEVTVYRQDLSLIVQFNKLILNFGNFMFEPTIGLETLGMENAGWLALVLSTMHSVLVPTIQLIGATNSQDKVNLLTFGGLIMYALTALVWTYGVLNSDKYSKSEKWQFVIDIASFLIVSSLLNSLIFAKPEADRTTQIIRNRSIRDMLQAIDGVLGSEVVIFALGIRDLFQVDLQDEGWPDDLFSIALTMIVSVIFSTTLQSNVDARTQNKKKTGKYHGMDEVYRFVKYEIILMLVLMFIIVSIGAVML